MAWFCIPNFSVKKKSFGSGATVCQTRERLFEELKITKFEKAITVTNLSSYLSYASYFEPLFRPLEKTLPLARYTRCMYLVPGNFVLMESKDEKLIA